MEASELKKLKSEGKSLKPFLQIGKNGVTENAISQIRNYLKANKLGKVKLSKSFLETQYQNKKEIAETIAESTKSEIIDQVGFVVVLWKR